MPLYTKIAPETSGEYNVTKENFGKINDAVYDTHTMILNVKAAEFGALGNGSHDDTANIQDAINALPASGGTIYFPPGTYNISGTLTFPTGNVVSGYYESPVVFQGAGMGASRIVRTADNIGIDASGSVAAGVVTMRRSVTIKDMTIDGGSTSYTTPLMRCFYNLDSRYYNVKFTRNGGPLITGVQYWDSYYYGCWFDNARGTTLSLDPAFNSGTAIMGSEAVRLTSVGGSGLGTSTMGYSTDNVNNIWFFGCNFTENAAGDIYVGQMGGSSQPHRIYGIGTKYECLNGAVGPRLRMYGAGYCGFTEANLLVNGLGSGIGSVDLINLTNVVSSVFENILLDQGSAVIGHGIMVPGGTNQCVFDNIFSNLNTGGTGTAPCSNATTCIYGQYTTASGQYGADKVLGFAGTDTGVKIGKVALNGSLGYLHDNNAVPYDAVTQDDGLQFGLGIKAWTPCDPAEAQTFNQKTSGVLHLNAVYLKKGTVITNLCVFTGTVASGATHAWLAVYNYGTSTAALLKNTADDTSMINNLGWRTVALSGGAWVVPSDGMYFLAFLFVATTMPWLLSNNVASGTGASAGRSQYPGGQYHWATDGGGDSALPNPATSIQSSSNTHIILAT